MDSESECLPPPATEWIRQNRKARRNREMFKKCQDECCGTPSTGASSACPRDSCAGSAPGNLNDRTFKIQGIFDDIFSEEDVKDILGFDAVRPNEAPWVYSSNGRRIVEVTMDSGAAATVAPRGTSIAKLGPVTKANCTNFRAANGNRIPKLGEQFIKGATADGREVKFRAQAADVTKPLASVHEMVE